MKISCILIYLLELLLSARYPEGKLATCFIEFPLPLLYTNSDIILLVQRTVRESLKKMY